MWDRYWYSQRQWRVSIRRRISKIKILSTIWSLSSRQPFRSWEVKKLSTLTVRHKREPTLLKLKSIKWIASSTRCQTHKMQMQRMIRASHRLSRLTQLLRILTSASYSRIPAGSLLKRLSKTRLFYQILCVMWQCIIFHVPSKLSNLDRKNWGEKKMAFIHFVVLAAF